MSMYRPYTLFLSLAVAMARWNILLCGANARCKASDDASAATDGPAAEQASSSDPQDFSLAGEAWPVEFKINQSSCASDSSRSRIRFTFLVSDIMMTAGRRLSLTKASNSSPSSSRLSARGSVQVKLCASWPACRICDTAGDASAFIQKARNVSLRSCARDANAGTMLCERSTKCGREVGSKVGSSESVLIFWIVGADTLRVQLTIASAELASLNSIRAFVLSLPK
mmetsp:Transcript_37603/g.88432  ORF Transcript_37603/g.88432 Transcript_37603/m.88432 type:complete len:226 (-) Transcript_37603:391-1068(-)